VKFVDELILKDNNVDMNYIKSEEKIEKRAHPFLPENFCSAIIGKPGSGKSFLIRNLLLNPKLYYKYFNFVYIFSPNNLDDKICQFKNNWFNTFDVDFIYQRIV